MTPWDFAAPHVIELRVQDADIDAYGHVNNSVYLTWLDRAAWSHSAALGIPLQQCLGMRRGMELPPMDWVSAHTSRVRSSASRARDGLHRNPSSTTPAVEELFYHEDR